MRYNNYNSIRRIDIDHQSKNRNLIPGFFIILQDYLILDQLIEISKSELNEKNNGVT